MHWRDPQFPTPDDLALAFAIVVLFIPVTGLLVGLTVWSLFF